MWTQDSPVAGPGRQGEYFRKLGKDLIRQRYIYLMALPVLLYYIIFHYIPMGGAVIAFQNYLPIKGLGGSNWVGLKHFVDFFTGPYAWRVIRNTLLLNFYDILFGFPAPILLALAINEVKQMRFKKLVQTVSYMPYFISLVVMCGVIVDFSRSSGLFNDIIVTLGGERSNLLIDPSLFRRIFVGSGIWKMVGWGSIIYLSSLASIDPSLYEAASMDGAGRIRQILHVTLPCLIPIMTIQMIMRIGNIMTQGFEKVILLYNPLTYETADVISSYVYRRGLEEMNYSVGSAIGLFNSLVNVVTLVAANYFFRAVAKESLW